MNVKTKVAIAGAGPDGLLAAILLHRSGVEAYLFDAVPGPVSAAGTLLLTPHTLELYDEIGLANDVLLGGKIIQRIEAHNSKGVRFELSFAAEGDQLTPFPFLLSIDGVTHQRLLKEYYTKIGGVIAEGTELLELSAEGPGVSAVLRSGEETFDLQTDHFIGTGDAMALIYRLSKWEPPTPANEHAYYKTTANFDNGDGLTGWIGREGALLAVPTADGTAHTVTGAIDTAFRHIKPDFEKEVLPIQNRLSTGKLESATGAPFYMLAQYRWWPLRCTDRSMHLIGERSFCDGDPLSDLYNSAVQDALNLCWKMSLVVRGLAAPGLLDTYVTERHPAHRQTIRLRNRLLSFASSAHWSRRWMRGALLTPALRLAQRKKSWRQWIYKTIIGTGHRYLTSPLTLNRITDPPRVHAGERTPFVNTSGGQSLHKLMRTPHFQALVFAPSGTTNLRVGLESETADLTKMLTIIDLSAETALMKKWKITRDTVVLVRPDLYIGLVTDEGPRVVGDYLRKLAVENMEEKKDTIKLPQVHP